MDAPQSSPPTTDRESSPSLVPRFSLRTLLILGVVFCLFFAWIGRHVYHLRKEQLAIEALKQAGGTFFTASMQENQGPFEDYDPVARLFGVSGRPTLLEIGLTCFDAEDPKADRAIAALTSFPELETVQLRGSAFDDASLAGVAQLPRVANLSLIDTEVTETGVADLKSTKIRSVVCNESKLTTELVDAVATLPYLDSLVIIDAEPVEPLSYRGLAEASRLRSLCIRNSGFQDDDVAAVSTLEQLEVLSIDGITDAGLEPLAQLSDLRELAVRPPVSTDAASRLSKSIPNGRVIILGSNPTAFVNGEVRTWVDY